MKITTSGYMSKPLGKTIGYNPAVVTGEVPPPIDFADGAAFEIPVFVEGGTTYYPEIGAAEDAGSIFTYARPGGPGFNFATYAHPTAGATDGVADGAGVLVGNSIGWEVTGPCTVTIHTFDWTTATTYSVHYGTTTETSVPTGDKTIIITDIGTVAMWMDTFVGSGLLFDGITVELGDDELVWVPAYNVNDNDNDTFDIVAEESVDAADGVFLRATLPVAAVLANAVLRLEMETAGSVTITVEGANEPDFSDAVVIGSETFDAIGP